MSASNTSAIPPPSNKIRRKSRSHVFGKEPSSSEQLIRAKSTPRRVAIVGNHLPRQCGIATFTNDLCDAIAVQCGTAGLSVVAVNDRQSSYDYPERVRFEIAEGDISSYRATAKALNSGNVDLVCLQHEYGIFGGKSGSYVLQFLRGLTMPVVTTLHTVLREPDLEQRIVLREIAALSDRLIVMSAYSSRVLQDVFGVPAGKIDLIPHGIPDLPFVEPEVYKNSLSIAGKAVLLTFGLLSTNKGFENVIRALPRILSRHENVIYVIAGATHPHVKAREGDRYRYQLQALAKELGVESQVIFLNRFVSPQEMASLVGSADIYITPYRFEAQAVSGTLAYALGAGKAIISTPYWHAAELLDAGRGVLVPFESPAAIAATAIELLDNDSARQTMRMRAYIHGRQMVWSRVAQSYMSSFARANVNHTQTAHPRLPVQSVATIAGSRLANA
jgi:glycosyltransferase involved in cell wall biosynthesis